MTILIYVCRRFSVDLVYSRGEIIHLEWSSFSDKRDEEAMSRTYDRNHEIFPILKSIKYG